MIKRIIDVVVSLLGLVAFLPLLVFIYCVVLAKMGRPALFRQVRPGFKGVPFSLIKFRTMRNLHDSTGRPLEDSQRLNSLGRFLRSTSLDELPELWNVLKGEMSLVGPRPLLVEYLPLYSDRQGRRHDIKPGITGWAQINGRNSISWNERLELDVWYTENQSLWLDAKILAMTVWKVVRRDGISAPGVSTQIKFTGGQNSTDSLEDSPPK